MSKPLLAAALTAVTLFAAEEATDLLTNGGFEDGVPEAAQDAQNWKRGQPDGHGDGWGSAVRVDWRAHGGKMALAIRGTWAGAGANGGVWQEAMAIPGQRYTASAWIWADGAWKAEKQELKIEFWSADHAKLLETHVQPVGAAGEEWAERTVAATAPADAGWVRVVVWADGVGEAGALQVDDIALKQTRAGG